MPTAWDSTAHAAEYDYLANAPRWLRKRFYEHYQEIKALPGNVSSIIEVGCATGELARYLIDRYPTASYTGFDVSHAAIERAREKCTGEFICGHFQDDHRTAELVICRDVVHHQENPWKFLNDLWRITQRRLVVRLRTGSKTERKSQLLYGMRVPYWVLSEWELRRWAKPGFMWFNDTEGPLPLWLRGAVWVSRHL